MLFVAKDVVGRRMRDGSGRAVGRITAFYRYPAALAAPWGAAAVTSGRIRRATHLVDLRSAVLDQDTVGVPHDARKISAAPNYTAMLGDTLSDHHAVNVLEHYGSLGQAAAA